MESLEMSAKTVEEAIQHALEQLGVSLEEVEVTVLKEGKSGVLGLGAEEARVRVRPLVSVPDINITGDVAELAKEVLERLLTAMGVSASVVASDQPIGGADGAAVTPITFDITGDDLGILIGRRGQTLACLQYVVRLIVSHKTKAETLIVVDVEGYKKRRYESLRALAQRLAEQVKASKVPVTLEPMPAYERRIVHLALAEHPEVTTQSIGVGEARRVVIEAKKPGG